MKFSEAWLRQWTNPPIDTTTLLDQLTMLGLEVDGSESLAGEFSGVVVSEILSCEQHPNADNLKVCSVSDGTNTVQIVCGAPNARTGIKIPLAKVGAVLPGNFKIKAVKLRGEDSAGMLCAREELNIAGDSKGIWELAADAPLGKALQDYLSLDDHVIEVDLTPNRADCLSIRGIARDVSVVNGSELTEVQITPAKVSHQQTRSIDLAAPQQCPQYFGRVITDINIAAETPMWMRERLERSDVTCISIVVDITNYVMLELGQPLHAFDHDKIGQTISIRMSRQNEVLTLLDGKVLTLSEGTLVIADETRAIALAGIMGGENSMIDDNTRHVFLESAFFNPLAIAGKARSYGMHTDASHRYERGVDPQLQQQAIERASELLNELAGGQAGPLCSVQDATHLPKANTVTLRLSRLEKILGMSFVESAVSNTLKKLGMTVESQIESNGDIQWQVLSPSWRFDIAIEEDLIEEVARIHGFENLPQKNLILNQPLRQITEKQRNPRLLADSLVSLGFREVINYSFIDPALHVLCNGEQTAVELKNAIAADMASMRTSLIPGMLKTAEYNIKRQRSYLRLFEQGLCFLPEQGVQPVNVQAMQQTDKVAAIMLGARQVESWANSKEKVDFFDIKALAESLIPTASSELSYKAISSNKQYHPSQCAQISLAATGQVIGMIGAVHPAITKKLGIVHDIFAFELDVSVLLEQSVPSFVNLSKFPAVRRDVALLVDREVSAEDLTVCAKQTAGELLSDIKIFDMYQGQGIDTNKKSIGLALTFRDSSRTLTDAEVSILVEALLVSFERQHNAFQR